MDGHLTTAVVSILTAVVGVALLATFLSRNSETANIITAGSSGFSQILGTALSPVTGGGGFTMGNNNNLNSSIRLY